MSQIFVPTTGPANWQALLADPVRHWRTGYSARSVAYAWEEAAGLPPEIAALLASHEHFSQETPELLAAFPEWKVPLPGGSRESQNDVFALVRTGATTLAVAVEGKVSEPFGPTVSDWLSSPSAGKIARLRFLCDLLGLAESEVADLRYQLLHRAASAVVERRRFGMDAAAMLVHSFSQADEWLADFASFSGRFGGGAELGVLAGAVLPSGDRLYLGWARGDSSFLER